MRRRFLLPVLVLGFLIMPFTARAADAWIDALGDASGANQLAIAAVSDGGTDGVFYFVSKTGDGWAVDLISRCITGSKGLGKEREGDKKTPSGVYTFNMAFGCADDPGCILPYRKVTENDYWSGDRREGYGYNTMVSLLDLPDLNKTVSDRITDYPESYKYCLNISWNEDCVPGKGAALFLHCIKGTRTSTEGCIAIYEGNMRYVITHVKPGCVLIIDYMSKLMGAENYIQRLPESTAYIGANAFTGCNGLKALFIPASVSYIAGNAFEDCGGIKILAEKDTYAERRCRELGIETITVAAAK